jgi:hypothetical protein
MENYSLGNCVGSGIHRSGLSGRALIEWIGMKSFQRWIKDLGNVVMVLIVLSDAQPIWAPRFSWAAAAICLSRYQ